MSDRPLRPARLGRRRITLLVMAVVLVVGVATASLLHRGNSAPKFAAVVGPTVPVKAPMTSTVPASQVAAVASPDQPVAVGVKTLTVTDLTRGTAARGQRPALMTRPLQLTVRYPILGPPSDQEVVDAPAFAPTPLVLFAHGYDITAERYSTLTHDLASFGFVVVSPEFPMSSTVFDGAPDEYDVPEQSRDLSFIISILTGPDAPAEVAGLVAPGPVGLIGHSDGAVTVLLTAYAPRFADPRVGAVVAISGDFDTFGGSWFSTYDPPLIAVHGEWDEINPFDSSQELVDNDPGWAMLVGVRSATHLAAAIDPANEPSVARLAGFNFLWRLTGSSSAEISTYQGANAPPLEVVDAHE